MTISLFPTLVVFFPMNQNSSQIILTFYSGLILLILAIERLGKRIAIDRAEGWLRLLQVTPLPPRVFIRSKILVNLLLSSLILLLLFSFGAFRLNIQKTLSGWLTLSISLLLGMIPFAIFGLAMGYLLSPKTVDSIIGLSVPLYHYSQLILSSTHFSSLKSDDQPLFHLLFLITFGLLFYLLAIWAYQRDQSLT